MMGVGCALLGQGGGDVGVEIARSVVRSGCVQQWDDVAIQLAKVASVSMKWLHSCSD